MSSHDTAVGTLHSSGRNYRVYDAAKACHQIDPSAYARLPYSLRVLAENIVRGEPNSSVRNDALKALLSRARDVDLPYRPSRVVLQDLLGTPALVDLAGLRDAVAEHGGNPTTVNPVTPVHLVVDHSLNVEHWGSNEALEKNMEIERTRNSERFSFLAWANQAFNNVSIIPSGKGILHQINIERLTPVIATMKQGDEYIAYPDTLVGTDSHTTMINAIGVLGWGVGGIEAEAAMLGKSLMMRLPEIVAVRLVGKLPSGYIATDLALALSETLRSTGVIGAYVEFVGSGVASLSLADRGTVSNMAPEFGATAAMFAIDERTIDYMRMTGRSPEACNLTRDYAKSQGLWCDQLENAEYDRTITIDLSTIKRAIAGPKQPHQRIVLGLTGQDCKDDADTMVDAVANAATAQDDERAFHASGSIPDGAVVIAAITSCTNTSNPRAILAAGLIARNALARGLKRAPWTKTSLAPGSRVVGSYIERAGLDRDFSALGFNIIGYGCTTCNGMSGPLLSDGLEQTIRKENIATIAVTSGNRNFEGRIHPFAREAFIMSPPLVVAYAIAGNGRIDPETDPLGHDPHGQPVFLRELWPSDAELDKIEKEVVTADLFGTAYADVPADLQTSTRTGPASVSAQYQWDSNSTYIKRPPYWTDACRATDPARDLRGMRVLAMLGDHITTDHISPSGAILPESDAGHYLLAHGVTKKEFNSYGTRRGNHEAAMRATFASPRLQNELVNGKEGPFTRLLPDGTETTIFQAAEEYARRGQALIVVAGQNYGSGSSRDWAAKGPRLLGVRVVLAESFERIHRSNLAGMGVLPLQFMHGDNRKSLRLQGDETYDIEGVESSLAPGQVLTVKITSATGSIVSVPVLCRLDTFEDIRFFFQGGLLPQLFNEYMNSKQSSTIPQ